MNNPLASIETALDALRQGRMIILIDDEQRENEGDLVIAGEKITPADVSFMVRQGCGLICLAMPKADLERLQIPPMVETNQTPLQTAFTVSIEAATGVTTGSSAFDRVRTIQVAINPQSRPADIVRPGHVFPLAAVSGGVFVRRGHTEGSVDLMRLAGLTPAAVIGEIMNENGSMARLPDLKKFAELYQLPIVSIQQIIQYRAQRECLLEELATTPLPLDNLGDFTLKLFSGETEKESHIALIRESKNTQQSPLVRIHSECLTGDVFGSSRCDCGWQLQTSLRQIAEEGGVFLYMRQEGRGIGLLNKIKAYHLQDKLNLDTVEANHHLGFVADQRNYLMSSQILRYLNITKIRLLTNNPHKIAELEGYGIKVVSRIPVTMVPHSSNYDYLKTKQEKLGHLLNL